MHPSGAAIWKPVECVVAEQVNVIVFKNYNGR